MIDAKMYTQLFVLADPWHIARINVDVAGEAAQVFIDHRHAPLPCPTCDRSCNVRDHTEERVWRHLDLWPCTTWLYTCLPRTDCPEHEILRAATPWAEPGASFSKRFEGRVMLALQACKTVSGASGLMQMSWDGVHGIMSRAVERTPPVKSQ